MRAEVNKCLEVLSKGGLILYPTDTIYGIGSDSHNNEAIDRINKLVNCGSEGERYCSQAWCMNWQRRHWLFLIPKIPATVSTSALSRLTA